MEITSKFSGIILKKAELDNDFERVYSRVFEKMANIEEDILEVLGNVGG